MWMTKAEASKIQMKNEPIIRSIDYQRQPIPKNSGKIPWYVYIKIWCTIGRERGDIVYKKTWWCREDVSFERDECPHDTINFQPMEFLVDFKKKNDKLHDQFKKKKKIKIF